MIEYLAGLSLGQHLIKRKGDSMPSVTFEEHLGIKLQERTRKPRKTGLTMVIDRCEPWQYQQGYLDAYADYIDVVKLTEPHLIQPLPVVQQKVDQLRRYGVIPQPGGIIIEIARAQGQGLDVLRKLREMGFEQIEVSSSANTQREIEEEAAYVQSAKGLGFKVIGEVGKKFPEGDTSRKSDEVIDVGETVRQMKSLLAAGCSYVYWEGHLTRRLIGEHPAEIIAKESTGTRQLLEVVQAVGVDNIIFEVSSIIPAKTRRAMQFWFVRLFGPNVNIGNARIDEINTIEATRLGTHPIFGFGPAGDHPWIHSTLDHGGSASPTWWKEYPTYPSPIAGEGSPELPTERRRTIHSTGG